MSIICKLRFQSFNNQAEHTYQAVKMGMLWCGWYARHLSPVQARGLEDALETRSCHGNTVVVMTIQQRSTRKQELQADRVLVSSKCTLLEMPHGEDRLVGHHH